MSESEPTSESDMSDKPDETPDVNETQGANETNETRPRARVKAERAKSVAQRERFITSLRNSANIYVAALAAGVSRAQVYRWKEQIKSFSDQWDEALEDALDTLEAAAWSRGRDGVIEPVYQGGDKVGEIRKYSDTLAMFMLRAHRPKKFRETSRTEITGADGGPIATKDESLTDAEAIEQLISIFAAAGARQGNQADSTGQPAQDTSDQV